MRDQFDVSANEQDLDDRRDLNQMEYVHFLVNFVFLTFKIIVLLSYIFVH